MDPQRHKGEIVSVYLKVYKAETTASSTVRGSRAVEEDILTRANIYTEPN